MRGRETDAEATRRRRRSSLASFFFKIGEFKEGASVQGANVETEFCNHICPLGGKGVEDEERNQGRAGNTDQSDSGSYGQRIRDRVPLLSEL